MSRRLAAIDVHKKVQMVVVATVSETVAEGEATQRIEFEGRRFGGGMSERAHVVAWLRKRGVEEVVMESTAQYWKPLWLDLEPHFRKLHLAQAHSNKAPKGRKNDFADAKRLARRLAAGELILSFVPDAEQRTWRTMTHSKQQLVCDHVRLQNQLKALLEEPGSSYPAWSATCWEAADGVWPGIWVTLRSQNTGSAPPSVSRKRCRGAGGGATLLPSVGMVDDSYRQLGK